MKNTIKFCFALLWALNLNGQVIFEEVGAPFPGILFSSIATADVDSDGDIDFFICGTSSSEGAFTRLYLNTGNGNFEHATATILPPNFLGDLELADIDADEDLDILLTGQYAGVYQTKLLVNNGDLTFTEDTDAGFTNGYGGPIRFADIDNDDDLDVMLMGITDGGEDIAELYWNDGAGNFTRDTEQEFPGTYFVESRFADVDNDNDLDLLIPDTFETVLYLNDGSGNFSLDPTFDLPACNSGDVLFFDKDGDGDLDLLMSGVMFAPYNTETTILYENDGFGNFSFVDDSMFVGVQASHNQVGDVDLDGDLDVWIIGISMGITVNMGVLYLNDGSGNFTAIDSSFFTPVSRGDGALVDLDNDGDLDLINTGSQIGGARVAEIYENVSVLSVDENTEGSFQIWPNPTQSVLNIATPFEQIDELVIYSSSGQRVMELYNLQSLETIDLEPLASGIYYLHLISDRTIQTRKIIKQ